MNVEILDISSHRHYFFHPTAMNPIARQNMPRWIRWTYPVLLRIWHLLSEPVKVFTESVRTRHISTDTVKKAILRSADTVARIYDLEPKHIIMGYDQLEELKGECQYHPFDASVSLDVTNGRIRKCCGMRIHLVPWFDGILVLPELEP